MDALVEMHDQAIRFLRDEGQRLLHVETTPERRSAVLAVLRGLERGPWAPGPVAVLDAAHGTMDPGWGARSEALRHQHEARRRAGVAAGEPWPSLPTAPSSKGLAGFAEQLGQVLAATPGGRGWVVVLAPAHVRGAPQWARALAMLLHGSALGRVRWAVVETEPATPLGDAVTREAELRRVACTGRAAGEPTPAGGGRGARPPGVQAPPRRGRPPTPEDPEAAPRQALAALVLDASRALREGQAARAVELQRRACDMCVAAGWHDLATQMQLVLGGYLVSAGSGAAAVQTAREAVQTALAQPHATLVPIARLALGSTLMASGQRPAAMLAYADAATSAEQLGATTLALEACRLTGDAAVLLGMEAQAIAFWSRAVALAEAAPAMAATTGAGHCARALALVCKRRGLHDAAERHWDAARRLEGIDEEAMREASLAARPRVAPAIEPAATVTPAPIEVTPAPTVTPAPIEVTPAPITLESTPAPIEVTPAPIAEPTALESTPEPEPLFVPSTRTAPFTGAVGEPPSPAAIEEGTADLSLEDLAALHWQGMIPGHEGSATPPTVIHHWTAAEQEAIRRATTAVMTEDSTSMLTREEVFALHGQAALPPAREASPAATAMIERATAIAMLRVTDPEAEGTAWIPEEALSAIRARFGRGPATAEEPPPPPAPAEPVPEARSIPEPPRGPGDTTSMLTRERIAELARQHAQRRKGTEP